MSYNWVQLLRSNEEQAFARADSFTYEVSRASALAKHISSVCTVFRDRSILLETQLQLHLQH